MKYTTTHCIVSTVDCSRSCYRYDTESIYLKYIYKSPVFSVLWRLSCPGKPLPASTPSCKPQARQEPPLLTCQNIRGQSINVHWQLINSDSASIEHHEKAGLNLYDQGYNKLDKTALELQELKQDLCFTNPVRLKILNKYNIFLVCHALEFFFVWDF